MSSDEEGVTDSENPGPQGHTKVYYATYKPWLCQEVRDLNDQVDELTEQYCRRTFLRGSMPHLRVKTFQPTESERVVHGLARNIYDDEFWDGIEEIDRDMIAPEEELHSFD